MRVVFWLSVMKASLSIFRKSYPSIMRLCKSIFLLFLCPATLFAQTDFQLFVEKNNLTPQGTVYINDSLFMDKEEVNNLSILEFLYFVKKDSSISYLKSVLPDSTINWRLPDKGYVVNENGEDFQQLSFHEYIINQERKYLRYPGYRQYPAIGVSLYQAYEYCKWRSNVVTTRTNELLARKKRKHRVRYNYYIPSLSEWELSVDSTIGKSKMKPKILKQASKKGVVISKKLIVFEASLNQKVSESEHSIALLINGKNFIGSSLSNSPNTKGLYNTYGNVSELTSTDGISYGGAWIHTYDEVINHKTFKYDKPDFWLGFRCACKLEITEN